MTGLVVCCEEGTSKLTRRTELKVPQVPNTSNHEQ